MCSLLIFGAIVLCQICKGRGNQPNLIWWTTRAKLAFKHLKRALCADPVFVKPHFSRDMIVQTDASETGLGAVLSQKMAREEHGIINISHKLLPREQHVTIGNECLVIKWDRDTLKYYFLGQPFNVVTNKSLYLQAFYCESKA